MSEGWRVEELGRLLEIQNGYAFKSKQFSTTEGTPLIRIRDIKRGISTETNFVGTYEDKYVVNAGDYLIGMDGDFGCYQWNGPPALLNQRVCRLQKFDDSLFPRFLFYGINQYLKEIEDVTTFVTVKHLSATKVKKIQFPIPPLAEQKRIVAILDEAFEAIDRAKEIAQQNLANARELFESYLNRVFTEKGKGWQEATFGGLVESGVVAKPLDGNHGEIHPQKADFVLDGVPFIMASHLVDGKVDQENCHFIAQNQAESLRKGFARSGDVLLSHKGTVGRTAILSTDRPYVVLTPQVTYYRILDANKMENNYLYFFFQSPSFQHEIGAIAGRGSTRAYIGITKQLGLHISFPSVEQQIEISNRLSKLHQETKRAAEIYEQKLLALSELKQSILQKAFTGQLTEKSPEWELVG